MIKLNELKKIGWDSISIKAHIIKPKMMYITEDIVTHIEGMELDEQFIIDFWIDIYVNNLEEEEEMKIGYIKGSLFTPMDFTRFGIDFYDVADCRGWDFYDMACAIIGNDKNIRTEIASEDDTICYIDDFYINKQYRNYGIGSYVINSIDEILYFYSNLFPNKLIVLPQPRVINKSKGHQNVSEKNRNKDLLMEKLIAFYKKNGFDFIENTKYMQKKIV